MRTLTSFIIGIFSSLMLLSPSVFAESYPFELSGPEKVTNGDQVTVVLEVKDLDGKPASEIHPEITFDPGENVKDEVLYDCGNEEFYDSCQANHQGVPGIFEVSFTLVDQPVLVEAKIDGVRRGVRLGSALSSEEALYEQKYAEIAAARNPQKSVKPEAIQAGPWPSYWMLVMPFLFLSFLLVLFVAFSSKK